MLSLFYIEKYKYTYILVEEKKKLAQENSIQTEISKQIYVVLFTLNL